MVYWRRYKPTVPKPVEDGIKARTRRGEFGETRIGKKWVEVLESFGKRWSNRLPRGRRYARRGQVVDYQIDKGQVTAQVQGSRKNPYKVIIKLKVFSKKSWMKIEEEISSLPLYQATFNSGKIPHQFEEYLSSLGLCLIPEKPEELTTSCSCPDIANPCKHIAAVCYLLGEAFDENPLLLLQIRGKSEKELLANLDQEADEKGEEEAGQQEPIPPDLSINRFWQPGEALSQVKTKPEPPKVDHAVLRLLGTPKFIPNTKKYRESLEKAYQIITQKSLDQSP